MEEDSDREILTLKTTYERKLQDEKIALHVRLARIFTTLLVKRQEGHSTCKVLVQQ